MQADFSVKRGSTANALTATLTDATGAAINLFTPAGTTVSFSMRSRTGTVNKVTGAAVTILDDGTTAKRGQVRYAWAAADIDTAGLFHGEFKLVYADAKILRVPEAGYLLVEVGDPLN